jgi:hypothetical protein
MFDFGDDATMVLISCSVANVISPKEFNMLFAKMQAFYPAKSEQRIR